MLLALTIDGPVLLTNLVEPLCTFCEDRNELELLTTEVSLTIATDPTLKGTARICTPAAAVNVVDPPFVMVTFAGDERKETTKIESSPLASVGIPIGSFLPLLAHGLH